MKFLFVFFDFLICFLSWVCTFIIFISLVKATESSDKSCASKSEHSLWDTALIALFGIPALVSCGVLLSFFLILLIENEITLSILSAQINIVLTILYLTLIILMFILLTKAFLKFKNSFLPEKSIFKPIFNFLFSSFVFFCVLMLIAFPPTLPFKKLTTTLLGGLPAINIEQQKISNIADE